jgi:hypothetical protein
MLTDRAGARTCITPYEIGQGWTVAVKLHNGFVKLASKVQFHEAAFCNSLCQRSLACFPVLGVRPGMPESGCDREVGRFTDTPLNHFSNRQCHKDLQTQNTGRFTYDETTFARPRPLANARAPRTWLAVQLGADRLIYPSTAHHQLRIRPSAARAWRSTTYK